MRFEISKEEYEIIRKAVTYYYNIFEDEETEDAAQKVDALERKLIEQAKE